MELPEVGCRGSRSVPRRSIPRVAHEHMSAVAIKDAGSGLIWASAADAIECVEVLGVGVGERVENLAASGGGSERLRKLVKVLVLNGGLLVRVQPGEPGTPRLTCENRTGGGSSRPVLGLDNSNVTLLRHFGPDDAIGLGRVECWAPRYGNPQHPYGGLHVQRTAVLGREGLWASDPEVSVWGRGQRCIALTTPLTPAAAGGASSGLRQLI